jgi:predicted metal-dependent peptidase
MTTTPVKDTEERRIKRARISIMREPQFVMWSGIMMIGKVTICDDHPSAATNGRDEIYGRQFIRDLSDRELNFVVLHENLHKAFKHLTTWKKLWKENPMLANAAMDYVINQMLVDMDPAEKWLAMPKRNGEPMGCLDARFRGMNTKQVYDILKQEQEERGGQPGRGQPGRGQPGDPGRGQPGDPGDADHSAGLDHHDWEGAEELSDGEKKELAREVEEAVRQGRMQHERMHGNSGGKLSRELGDMLDPQIDWREALREFVTSICNAKDTSSWRRVNRRFVATDLYMPSWIGERVGRLVVGVDTSGSIDGKALTNFLTEVRSIADTVRPEAIDLIYWDARVAGHETYTEGDMDTLVASTKPKGGGGTDPRCVLPFLKGGEGRLPIEPQCIVMLTDGYVPSWGADWPAPILWVVAGNPGATATVGKTIHIKD